MTDSATTAKQVTELACLRIIPQQQEGKNNDNDKLPRSLLEDLSKAQKAMETSSKAKFAIYKCIEDPSILYILGSWPSITFHRKTFIPSPANQELLSLLSGRVEVLWMFHCDISVGEWDHVFLDGDSDLVISIARHFVSSSSQRDRFQDCFDENVRELKGFVGDNGVVIGGWRVREQEERGDDDATNVVDNDDDDNNNNNKEQDPMRLDRKSAEEFVLFASWPSVQRHYDFAQTEGFKKYARIREYCDLGAEIKHVGKIDLEKF